MEVGSCLCAMLGQPLIVGVPFTCSILYNYNSYSVRYFFHAPVSDQLLENIICLRKLLLQVMMCMCIIGYLMFTLELATHRIASYMHDSQFTCSYVYSCVCTQQLIIAHFTCCLQTHYTHAHATYTQLQYILFTLCILSTTFSHCTCSFVSHCTCQLRMYLILNFSLVTVFMTHVVKASHLSKLEEGPCRCWSASPPTPLYLGRGNT